MTSIMEGRKLWAHGERAGSATAVQLANVPAVYIWIKASADNAGYVYLGTSAAVTVKAGTTTTTAGIQIAPGEMIGPLHIDNLNRFYIICDNAGDDITYLAGA